MNLPRCGDGSASRSMPERATTVRATPNQTITEDGPVEPGQAPIHAKREEQDAGNRCPHERPSGRASPERETGALRARQHERDEGRSAEERAGGGVRKPLRVRSDPGREVLELKTRHDHGEEKCGNKTGRRRPAGRRRRALRPRR